MVQIPSPLIYFFILKKQIMFINVSILVQIINAADLRWYYGKDVFVVRVDAKVGTRYDNKLVNEKEGNAISENFCEYGEIKLAFWDYLGTFFLENYKIGDYIIVEGVLSLRKRFYNSIIQMLPELTVYRLYPFLLTEDDD